MKYEQQTVAKTILKVGNPKLLSKCQLKISVTITSVNIDWVSLFACVVNNIHKHNPHRNLQCERAMYISTAEHSHSLLTHTHASTFVAHWSIYKYNFVFDTLLRSLGTLFYVFFFSQKGFRCMYMCRSLHLSLLFVSLVLSLYVCVCVCVRICCYACSWCICLKNTDHQKEYLHKLTLEQEQMNIRDTIPTQQQRWYYSTSLIYFRHCVRLPVA